MFGHPRGKRAFTLLEVMVSLMILSVITVSIFTLFAQTLNTWTKAAADMEKYSNARAFLDRISSELTAATIDRWNSIYFIGYIGPSGVRSSTFDEIYFVSNTASGDLAEIGYWLDDQGYIQRYQRTAGLKFADPNYLLFSATASNTTTIQDMASNITGLYFCYWKEGDTAWPTAMPPVTPPALRIWDSRPGTTFVETITPSDANDDSKLPEAVRVTIRIKDNFTKNDEFFTTVVYVPEAEIHNNP